MIFGNAEYDITPKQLRCVIIVVISLLLLWAGITVWNHVSVAYAPFEKTYSGIEWYVKDTAVETVEIVFSGEKNMAGEFIGDITVYKGDEAVCVWTNCKVYRYRDHEFYICPENAEVDIVLDDGGPDMELLMMNCHAIMFSDAQWSDFTLHLSRKNKSGLSQLGESYTLFSSVDTLEEAQEKTAKWSEGAFVASFYDDFRKN